MRKARLGMVHRGPQQIVGEICGLSYSENMATQEPVLSRALNIANAWKWDDKVELKVVDSGLINQSFVVHTSGRTAAVLQHLNTSIVPPAVNEDIENITAWIANRGITTPRLIRTKTGALWAINSEGETWRCLTHVGERTIHTFACDQQARSAAHLVARFHVALKDFGNKLHSPRKGAQDTEKHLKNLRAALMAYPHHQFYDHISSIAERIERIWELWQGPGNLPVRIIHGDLKLSNIRFEGDEALAVIDLDTFANSTLDVELGDALRSWCNTVGENSTEAIFDLNIFSAAIQGFGDGGGEEFATRTEWASIVPGLERITLNLTARFAADALQECYFGWDERYQSRGEHNLMRARGQLNLLDKIRANRASAERVIKNASSI